MRANQIDLQFSNLIACDAYVAQFTHSGRDGVGDFVARDDVIDYRTRLIDCVPCIRGKQHGAPVFDARNLANRFKRQIVPVNVECVQESI
jgi:hypothetical protein